METYKNKFNFETTLSFEAQGLSANNSLISYLFDAVAIQDTTASLLDKSAGIDLVVQRGNGKVYGVGVRCRREDYGTFTVSKHTSRPNSQMNRVLDSVEDAYGVKPMHPQYILQLNGCDSEWVCRGSIILVQVPVFASWVQTIDLEQYYIPYLDAYEFAKDVNEPTSGIRNLKNPNAGKNYTDLLTFV
jgi:hypothetical protein